MKSVVQHETEKCFLILNRFFIGYFNDCAWRWVKIDERPFGESGTLVDANSAHFYQVCKWRHESTVVKTKSTFLYPKRMCDHAVDQIVFVTTHQYTYNYKVNSKWIVQIIDMVISVDSWYRFSKLFQLPLVDVTFNHFANQFFFSWKLLKRWILKEPSRRG